MSDKCKYEDKCLIADNCLKRFGEQVPAAYETPGYPEQTPGYPEEEGEVKKTNCIQAAKEAISALGEARNLINQYPDSNPNEIMHKYLDAAWALAGTACKESGTLPVEPCQCDEGYEALSMLHEVLNKAEEVGIPLIGFLS